MNKKINYLARDFGDIKSELIHFSKKYYPELTDTFNDASVGSWFIDLVSAVGDNLSYHTDRMYQENNPNFATTKNSILNYARINNIKIPGPKASMCEVELSCILPILYDNSISLPNWELAPIIKMGSIVGNSSYYFELTEDVDFGSQFNSDGVSNRKFIPIKNNNNQIISYKITKSVLVYGGRSKVYKKVMGVNDVEPFMEVILPEKDIMNVESVIFKEGTSFTDDPKLYEYYVEEENYKVDYGENETHRYFEVGSLGDQYVFRPQMNKDLIHDKGNDDCKCIDHNCATYDMLAYEDVTETTFEEVTDESTMEIGKFYLSATTTTTDTTTTTSKKIVTKTNDGKIVEISNIATMPSGSFRTTRYYRGKWKGITQKFMTEYTDNGYMKLIFGGGSLPTTIERNTKDTIQAQHILSHIVNNDYLGKLPSIGWTMYVLYRVGGGTETNLAPGSINTLISISSSFKDNGIDAKQKTDVLDSLTVTNISPSVGGKDMPDENEMKFLIKYSESSQDRCISLKDYKSKIMMIPPKYGCPFRCNAIERNNKIVIPCLGLNSFGKLTAGLPKIMSDNIIEYLSHYKNLGDYVELNGGKIYNVAFEVDVFINKNYVAADVIRKVIDKVYEYMSVSRHDIGEDIFIGDLNKEINLLDGVISLIDLRVYNVYGGKYSPYHSPLPKKSTYSIETCKSTINIFKDLNSSFEIDLSQTDSTLYGDYDSMYEILDPNTDIIVKTKLK